MTWVLIIAILYSPMGGPAGRASKAMTAVPGYPSEDLCKQAGAAAKIQGVVVNSMCIPGPPNK
jgi:hypothetical protein